MTDGNAAPDPPSEPVPAGASRHPLGRTLLIGVTVGVAYLFRGLLLPLLLAAFLAYLLNPLVVWAESFAIRRSVAVAGLYLAVIAVLAGLWLTLGGRLTAEAVGLAQGLPTVAAEVEAAVDAAGQELAHAYPGLRRFVPRGETLQAWIDQAIERRAENVEELLHHAGTVFILVVLVPFFTFFLLRDSGRMTAFVMDRMPPVHIETSVAVWCELNRIIGRYLRGVALDGLVIGILAALGLWLVGVPYPIFLGLFAGLANAVPYLGPILGASAAGLVVLTETHSLAGVGPVVLLFLGIKLLDDAVIQPLTIGRSVHLHPMLLLGSVVAGNQGFGVLGMVVAVPVVTVVQETARLLIEHRRTMAGRQPTPAELGAVHHLV